MAPVFSLVLDEDVSSDIALMYPELYRDLMKVCRPPAQMRNSFHKQEEYEKESDAYSTGHVTKQYPNGTSAVAST